MAGLAIVGCLGAGGLTSAGFTGAGLAIVGCLGVGGLTSAGFTGAGLAIAGCLGAGGLTSAGFTGVGLAIAGCLGASGLISVVAGGSREPGWPGFSVTGRGVPLGARSTTAPVFAGVLVTGVRAFTAGGIGLVLPGCPVASRGGTSRPLRRSTRAPFSVDKRRTPSPCGRGTGPDGLPGFPGRLLLTVLLKVLLIMVGWRLVWLAICKGAGAIAWRPSARSLP